MARLFVAVNLPADIRQGAWRAAAPLRTASYPIRWVDVDALHVTLKFLGAVTPEQEPGVVAAMEQAVDGGRPFPLPVGGFGAFPSASRARVVWVGCEAVAPLELIQHRLEKALEPLGFELEARAFRPHVTLGRVKDRAAPRELAGLEAALEDLQFDGEATVSSLDLMESHLGSAGARYTVRRPFPLVAS